MIDSSTRRYFYSILMVALVLTLTSCGGSSSSGSDDPIVGGGGGGGGGSDPVFGGVTNLEQAGTARMVVYWAAATDDVSSSNNITYNIYLATTTGGQNFITPTASSTPGAAYVILTGLAANTGYFVIVRAQDEAMNEETNTTELTVSTAAMITSLSGDVQPILDNDCTLGCHTTGMVLASLDLADGMTHSQMVNVNSRQCTTIKMVAPNDAIASYLINKLNGVNMCNGSALMPFGAIALANADIQTIKNWIWDGAPDN